MATNLEDHAYMEQVIFNFHPAALVHIPAATLKVYLTLLSLADNGGCVENTTRDKLATLCNYKSQGSVTEHIRFLARHGALDVHHNIKPDGTRGPDTYLVKALA